MGSRLCNSVHRHQQNISDYLVNTVCQVYRAPICSDEFMTSTNLIKAYCPKTSQLAKSLAFDHHAN